VHALFNTRTSLPNRVEQNPQHLNQDQINGCIFGSSGFFFFLIHDIFDTFEVQQVTFAPSEEDHSRIQAQTPTALCWAQ